MLNQTVPRGRSKLNPQDATALARYGARTIWPSNFQIYQQATEADGISLVLRGHVILRNRVRTGRGFVPAVIIPGETFGIEGLSPEAIYVTDAQASEETETLFVSGRQFRAFVRENPAHAIHLIGQLMSERSALLDRLYAVASQNVEQRLMSSLHRLSADRSFIGTDGRLRVELKHHRLLCEMVGATRESVALALGRMALSGIAEKSGVAFLVAPCGLAAHINARNCQPDNQIQTNGEWEQPQRAG